MSLKHFFSAGHALAAGILMLFTSSCVYMDEEFGRNFIPQSTRFALETASYRLTDIGQGLADSLSGYSSSRITVGAIRKNGSTETRSSAFTLVPIVGDNLDFGTDWENIRFHFTAVRDTFSVSNESQKGIIQNINVYELSEALDDDYMYTNSVPKFDSSQRISKGVVTYNGGDSLSFDFTEEFALKFLKNLKFEDLEDMEKYAEKFPGIYLTADIPGIDGGRINMFDVNLKVEESYIVSGNFAELAFTAKYGEREKVDTSFMFFFGPQERSTKSQQFALNICSHSSKEGFPDDETVIPLKKGENILVEGGAGMKPVIRASEIKNILLKEFGEKRDPKTGALIREAIDTSTVVINKATIVLPFEFPADYKEMSHFPPYLNPTSRISGNTETEEGEKVRFVTYAGLTDASVSTENQGQVNRSLLRYNPDISHHVQEIFKKLKQKDENLAENKALFESYDVWMLIMSEEQVTTSKNNQMNDYLQNLAYANYYNSMYDPYGYGGYYGGYGGYGYGYGGYGYGYGYSNYYNYMAAQQMNSGEEKKVVTQLDKDRYYNCRLLSPDENAEISSVPHLKIVYSYVPKTVKNAENSAQ